VHADRRDLPSARPDAGAGVAERDDERFLDLAQIPVQIAAVPLQVEDRIADELPWAMKGDVPAALDLVDFDAARVQALRRCGEMVLLRGASKRHDGRMLEQEEHVLVDLARDAPPREIALELQGDLVRDGPKLRR
jgi:hypothetical protein